MWKDLVGKIMPNVWLVYILWFIGAILAEGHLESAHVLAIWSAFGGSVATFALTLAKKEEK